MFVISDETPSLSRSEYDSSPIRPYSAERRSAAKPVAAFAAKYCATTAKPNPTAAKATSMREHLMTTALSPPFIPLSIMCDTIKGTQSSSTTSKSLKHGESTLSFLYF